MVPNKILRVRPTCQISLTVSLWSYVVISVSRVFSVLLELFIVLTFWVWWNKILSDSSVSLVLWNHNHILICLVTFVFSWLKTVPTVSLSCCVLFRSCLPRLCRHIGIPFFLWLEVEDRVWWVSVIELYLVCVFTFSILIFEDLLLCLTKILKVHSISKESFLCLL